MRFNPSPLQEQMIEHIVKHPRCGIWAAMGTGKTSATLHALSKLHWTHDVFPALVLAPLRVAQSTWPDEVAKWKNIKNHLTVTAVVGDAAQRRRQVRTQSHIYTTNYEQIPNLVALFGRRWPFRTIIADESTRLKSFRLRQGGKRAQALNQVAWLHPDARFIELTGTPSPNGLIDLWGQSWFLDRGQRLGQSFTAFKERWFQRGWDGYSLDALPHAQKEIENKLSDICISIMPQNIEKPIHNTLYIDLPQDAAAVYKQMERTMFAEINEQGVNAVNAAVRTNKCLQLANGAVYSDEKRERWEHVHDAKLDILESIVEEAAGMPILVAYHFRHDLERLLVRFPQGKVLDKNAVTIKQWNAGHIPILFAHPASAGHGLNLQYGSNILVFFGHTWNLEEYEQIIERIGPMRQKQAGLNRPVFVHHIIARGTIEEDVIWRLEKKSFGTRGFDARHAAKE